MERFHDIETWSFAQCDQVAREAREWQKAERQGYGSWRHYLKAKANEEIQRILKELAELNVMTDEGRIAYYTKRGEMQVWDQIIGRLEHYIATNAEKDADKKKCRPS